jgi:signal transduction histidine kinase
VSIEVVDQILAVEVADNGIEGADPAKGTGLLGLQDRLDVLGGLLAVESSEGGTRVRGVIPLERSEIFPAPSNAAAKSGRNSSRIAAAAATTAAPGDMV